MLRPLPCCLCAPPDVDSGYYTVKFDSLLLKEAVVEGDSILPPLRTEPAGSSDSDGSDVDDPSYARGMAAATPRGSWLAGSHTVVSARTHSGRGAGARPPQRAGERRGCVMGLGQVQRPTDAETQNDDSPTRATGVDGTHRKGRFPAGHGGLAGGQRNWLAVSGPPPGGCPPGIC